MVHLLATWLTLKPVMKAVIYYFTQKVLCVYVLCVREGREWIKLKGNIEQSSEPMVKYPSSICSLAAKNTCLYDGRGSDRDGWSMLLI